jgi:hypothetical protein
MHIVKLLYADMYHTDTYWYIIRNTSTTSMSTASCNDGGYMGCPSSMLDKILLEVNWQDWVYHIFIFLFNSLI